MFFKKETQNESENKIILTQAEANYIWSCLKEPHTHIPSKNLAHDPFYFITLNRDKDIEIHKKLCNLLNQKENIDD